MFERALSHQFNSTWHFQKFEEKKFGWKYSKVSKWIRSPCVGISYKPPLDLSEASLEKYIGSRVSEIIR